MKNKTLMMGLALFLLVSCAAPQTSPITIPVSTATPQANMPNPASSYCEQQGNKLEIRTAADGSQSGVCIFPNGSECEEWAYFRGECKPTPPVTETSTVNSNSSGSVVIPQKISMPAGVIIDPRNSPVKMTKGLMFLNPDDLSLGELLAPNAGDMHAAGHYQGSLNFPLVFQTFDYETQRQYLSMNSGSTQTEPGGQVSMLKTLDDRAMLSGLVGVPGEPIIFYIVFKPIDANLQSQFVFGKLDTIATAEPILTQESNESMYSKPVAIQMKDGAPNGLWFTRIPWGIGGDIVFGPSQGLSYLELGTNTIHEVLPSDIQFTSLSEDQTWVAYTIRKGTRPEFFIRNLTGGGEPISIPSLPESDRGAGDGIFSPSNKYIAWREAQGSLFDDSFHQTIRIAAQDGQILGDFKDIPFYKTAELNTGAEVKPVGWLNDENLLVQVVAPEKPGGIGAVVKLNVVTGQFTLFAQGFFAGWFHP
jgi:putative hemolysin